MEKGYHVIKINVMQYICFDILRKLASNLVNGSFDISILKDHALFVV